MLLLGGQETLSTLAAATLCRAAAHPIDPTRWEAVIDEVARLVSPTQFMFRSARQDTSIDGVRVPAGARVLLLIAAANRDAGRFPCPDEFRVDRMGARPLSFGVGAHACLGQWLSRTSIRVTMELLSERRPEIFTRTLQPKWAFSGNVRCLESLTIG